MVIGIPIGITINITVSITVAVTDPVTGGVAPVVGAITTITIIVVGDDDVMMTGVMVPMLIAATVHHVDATMSAVVRPTNATASGGRAQRAAARMLRPIDPARDAPRRSRPV